MTNLVDIQNQIAALQKQADEIKSQEFDKTVADILEKMAAFGITLKDLEAVKGRARKVSAPVTKQAAAKFRGPNGETWSGRGLMPRWLTALVAQGRAKDDFAITN